MSNSCIGKTPIPITGSTFDATEYVAINYPYGIISDYTFVIPPSMVGQIGVMGGVMCPQYDYLGGLVGYLAYISNYRYSHTTATSTGIFDIAPQPTYWDYVNTVNAQIGIPITANNIININTPWDDACLAIDTAIVSSGSLAIDDMYGCAYEGAFCECPGTIVNPCVDAAIAAGMLPSDTSWVPWVPLGQYVTGNFVEYPLSSGNHYILLTPFYSNINPFTFTPPETPQSNDLWWPCDELLEPIICDCPATITYPGTQQIPTVPTGLYDPTMSYVSGEIFQMDWYNFGLQLLLSHPDPNFVDFITLQGLSNPISSFELPFYDVVNQEWTLAPNIPPEVVEFMGPCTNTPGASCYIFLGGGPGDTSAPFVSSKLTSWQGGSVIPGLAINQSAAGPGIAYWATPTGYIYESWFINQANDAAIWADYGLASMNRAFVCCHDLTHGCQDPFAVNYQPYVDFSCKDINPVDGVADCCDYGLASECLPILTKEEFLMNVAQKPETRSDVFIERGKTSVFERTQRLAQTPTIGELELHGYGYYKINEQRF